jgi:RNA polymerase sigma-70 factor (ECF subfamily)
MSEGLPEPEQPAEAEQVNPGRVAAADDLLLLHKLRAGDEAAFAFLLDQYCASMSRLAMLYVPDRAVAEEVVQEAWMGILQVLDRFEGRSSVKTWMFRILLNVAKTHGQRESRSVPFSALWEADAASAEPAFDVAGYWVSFPRSWGESPEEQLLSQETPACIQLAIGALPLRQRVVITLRDVEGWTSREVADLLGISEANQRVRPIGAKPTLSRLVFGSLERKRSSGRTPPSVLM